MDRSESEANEPEAPESIRHLRWATYTIRKYRADLVRPPVLAAVGIFLAVGVYAGTLWNRSELSGVGSELSVANGTIGLLTTQITAYKDKLNGKSPDEAAKQIADLEAEVSRQQAKLQILMPDVQRRLTDKQKSFIIDHAKDFKEISAGAFVYSWNAGDAPLYATDFVKAFKRIGIDSGGVIETFCDDTQHGVLVGVPTVGHPSSDALRFTALLTEMGLSPKFTSWDTDPKAKPDFDLFICG
jgi:hypothetical protein